MKRKLLYLMTIIVALLATCIAFVSCSDNATSKSYKYHKDNIKTLSSVVDSSMAESMLSALETSCAIGTNTKLVAEDMREINDNCYELYAGLMVRFYVQDGQLLLYTFETNYNDDSKILLYNSSEPDKKKVLTETERKSLVYTQRRAVVHSTLAITPREGALLHNALGSTRIDLTFKNKSSSSIVYLHINTTPCISGVEYSYNGKGYVLNEDLPVGGSMTRSLTTTGWKNYDSYKITKATIMFADGSTIGFDSFDCQFLDGNGDSPDTILRDSQITYHLYDEQTEVQNFYSGFGNGLNTPYRYGYNFLGWYDNAECVGDSIEKIAIGKQVNIDLYAKWEEKNYINYHYQYEDKEEKVYVEDGETPTITIPTRLGYTFDGWYNNTSFEGNAITEMSPLLESVELYAKWTGNPVYLMYDGNGSTSGQMSNQLFRVGDTLALNENRFLRDGYTFIGWSIEKTSNDIIQDKGEYTMQPTTYEAVKIYARWSKEIKTVADFNTINSNNAEHYTLLNDIDFKNQSPVTVEKFYGVFDGNGYALKNSRGSLFYDNYGTIINLTIQDCVFSSHDYFDSCGGLLLNNYGILSACGVVATNLKTVYSYYEGILYADQIGGICLKNSGVIINSFSILDATISGYKFDFIGGICAVNDGDISDSFSKINLLIETSNSSWDTYSSFVGGLVGRNSSNISFNSTISNCYAVGNIDFEIPEDKNNKHIIYAGGLVGTFYYGTINNSFSNVSINSNFDITVGGLVGACHYCGNVSTACLQDIKNCFAVGKITTTSGSLGGLLGYSNSCNTINCFRSEINIFANGTVCTEGVLTENEQFYSKEFYIENNLLEIYLDEATLQENKNAVWIIVDGELPKLYWE